MGIANLFGAAFNCYTTTGSFSRSAVMDSSGAKSQVAGIVSAIVVMFVLLFLTPVFKNMPQNVQGAIVIAAVLGLFNYSEWFFLWKVTILPLIDASTLSCSMSSCSVFVASCHHCLCLRDFHCHKLDVADVILLSSRGLLPSLPLFASQW